VSGEEEAIILGPEERRGKNKDQVDGGQRQQSIGICGSCDFGFKFARLGPFENIAQPVGVAADDENPGRKTVKEVELERSSVNDNEEIIVVYLHSRSWLRAACLARCSWKLIK